MTDMIVWRPDLHRLCNVCSETVRRWIKSGLLPAPDVAITRQTMGWKISTLEKAGIHLASPQSPPTS